MIRDGFPGLWGSKSSDGSPSLRGSVMYTEWDTAWLYIVISPSNPITHIVSSYWFTYPLTTANTYTVRDVEGFLSEAVKLQGMEHANLLTVLGVVIENNRPFMVLPLMDHGDMKSFLAQPEQVRMSYCWHSCIPHSLSIKSRLQYASASTVDQVALMSFHLFLLYFTDFYSVWAI